MMGRRGDAGNHARQPEFDDSGTGRTFDPALLGLRMAAFSRLTYRAMGHGRIIAGRRGNYRRMLDAVSDLPGCRPLFRYLPDGVVPYLFPLWIDDLDTAFPRLEDLAVPMQRFGQFLWNAADGDDCAVSAGLSRHVVQFSCHQELTREEMDSIINRVRATVGVAARRRTVPA